MADEELAGRIAFVSGAAGGIGAAIAARFRRAGARVAGIDLAPSAAADVGVIADLADSDALTRAFAEAESKIGAPDILVHAAAASVFGGTLDTIPADYLRLYDVNAVGAVRLLQLAVPAMRLRGGGAVILFSSINAAFATPTLAAYAMTKAAIENLTQTAALELAPDNIRVNAIAPASVDTPLLRASYGRAPDPIAAQEANVRRHPLARLGSAEEVAELALFLASDRAAWITGAVYPIDGGARVTRS